MCVDCKISRFYFYLFSWNLFFFSNWKPLYWKDWTARTEKDSESRARKPTTTECPRQTGPQARVSGKDNVPPAKRRWVPPSTLRHRQDAFATTPESRNDLVFRKVRGILNKLTPEKFEKLSDDLLRTELSSSVILKGK